MKKQKYTFAMLMIFFLTSLSLKGQNYQTSFEPNNDFYSSVNMMPNTMLQAAISTSSDNDYYKIYVGSSYTNPVLTLSLSNLSQDYDLYLYNPNGNLISSSTRGGTESESITITPTMLNRYYTVRVIGYNSVYGTDWYRLTNVVYSNVNICGKDEPNNGPSEAKYFPLTNSAMVGCIHSGDIDYYSFRMEFPGDLTVHISNLVRNYDFDISNQAGTILSSSHTTRMPTEYLTLYGLYPGYFIIRVYGANGASGPEPYMLHLERTYDRTNAFEPNESYTNAWGAPDVFHAAIGNPFDVDWYRINLQSATTINIKLVEMPYDYDLSLHNSSGAYIAGSALSSTSNETINYSAQPGVYYFKIYGYNGAYDSKCYRVFLNGGYGYKTGEEGLEIEKVDDPFDQTGIEVFPNPIQMNGELNVKIGNAVSDGKFSTRVIGMDGSIISEQEIIFQSGQATIDIAGIKPGIYMLDLGEAGKHKLVIK